MSNLVMKPFKFLLIRTPMMLLYYFVLTSRFLLLQGKVTKLVAMNLITGWYGIQDCRLGYKAFTRWLPLQELICGRLVTCHTLLPVLWW